MLVTKIEIPAHLTFSDVSFPHLKKRKENDYELYLKKLSYGIADIRVEGNIIEIKYSEDLELEHFVIIHELIEEIQKKLQATIDDSQSFLGYTSKGEEAFIIKNWNEWMIYIHQSMKHCQ